MSITVMTPKQTGRVRLLVTFTDEWRDLLRSQAEAEGLSMTALYRKALRCYMRARRVATPPERIGRWARAPYTPRERALAKRAAVVRRYRRRKRERARGGCTVAWQITEDGCITTAELACLAQAVGRVSPSGYYTHETHRYQMPVIVQAVQQAVDRGELTDARWPLFIARYTERTE